jgi:ATP/maltotriose-dependent transcriptional regulator MalT
MAELHHILLGKLNRPHLGYKTLVRRRLYQQIDQCLENPVATIVAPAGFGKTVLLTDWMAQQPLPAAWFSLDENDNYLLTFVRYLALAIEAVFPMSCRETLSLANGLLPTTLANLTDSLLVEVGDLPKSIVLILDDYHVLVNPDIHTLVASLIDHVPGGLHLIISSRSVPPLPLARWRLNGLLGEIHASDLRFNLVEGGELMQLLLGVEIPFSVNTAIAERTEGWAAGLRLTALSLQGQSDLSTLSSDFLRHQRYIMDYLMDEVFARQTPALRDLLLKSSILDWMSEPLLTALSGAGIRLSADADPDADLTSLSHLFTAGLFIDQVAGPGNLYRYHDLFRDLLQQRLKAQATPHAIAALHREASCWLAENGHFEDAVRHALAAGDPLAAARVVEEQVHSLLNSESKTRLERLLNLLPPQLCEERAPLLIARAWIMHFEQRLIGIYPLLQRADRLLQHTEGISEAEISRCRGDILTLQSQVQFWQNNPSEALELASQAVAATATTSHFVRGLAIYYQGLSLHVSGEPIMAKRLLREDLEQSTPASAAADTRILLGLCVLLQDSLQIDQLGSTAQIMLRQAEANGFLISQAWGHYFQGRARYEKNDLASAQFHFLAGASLRRYANGMCSHECLAGLALTYAAQGQWQRADETAATLIEFDSTPLSEERLVHARALQARLALMRGDRNFAWRWSLRSELETLFIHLPLLEMASVTRILALMSRQTREDAQQALKQARQLQRTAESISSTLRLVQALTLQALALDALGDTEPALDILKQTIDLAQWERLIRIFVDFGPALGGQLSRLLKSGLVTHQEMVDYGIHLLAQFPTVPDAPSNRRSSTDGGLIEPLTARQAEVLVLLAQRLTDREIADTLVISPFTVRRHVRDLSRKIGAHGRRALVERARSLGLLPPQLT